MRLSEASTSADVKALPLWNLTFGRRLKVRVCELFENFQDFASPGTTSSFEFSWTSVP